MGLVLTTPSPGKKKGIFEKNVIFCEAFDQCRMKENYQGGRGGLAFLL